MGLFVVILLIALGLLFIILEVLVFPGVTFVGVVGLVLMSIAVWGIFDNYGNKIGYFSILAVVGISIFLVAFSLKTGIWKKNSLDKAIESRVNTIEENKIKKGDQGLTISRLNPMGRALIGDEYYEVRTHGDFIDENKNIEIIEIDNNRIFVKKV